MARKRKFESNLLPVDKYLSNLKYKDLKRECVIRGMSFDKIIDGSFPKLTNWLRNHFDDNINHDLLNSFDDWQEAKIKEAVLAKGMTPTDIIHPSLRLGYIAERDSDGNITKTKRVRTVIKRKKKRRDKTENGIYSGTKKALTFELQKQGLSKVEVTKKVLEEYPQASEKSISVWYNKSKNSGNGKKTV